MQTTGDPAAPSTTGADQGTERPGDWPSAFEEAVVAMLPEVPGGHRIAPDTDLAALGLDSLGRTGLVLLLQDEWDVEFPDEVLIGKNFETPATLWAAVSPFLPEGR
ncbi:phosphopantetheine-binding protein [Polymorphospora lycopeni]|uniref:Phosphopantetheine-binding protein n=1 Tax=Polymorphospora lycopeni TaxID=3140240 RepID=A0ABV5CVT6_9ACTN